MTIGVNTLPLAGKEGDKLTARLVKSRLDAELIGNVSIRVLNTERPDTWEVQARGELQLAVLVEIMRREGFELTVGKPQVVTTEIDGKLHEPVERLTIDVPEEYLGAVTQLLAAPQGPDGAHVNHGTGWVRMEYLVPARGLHRLPHRVHDRDPGHRHRRTTCSRLGAVVRRAAGPRAAGSIVADRTRPRDRLRHHRPAGAVLRCSSAPGVEVYEGMIVGENSRSEDMDVNICREKKLTNMRASSSDNTDALIPPRQLSLEQALEFIADRRVRRGHPGRRPAAQGRAGRRRPGPQDQAAQERPRLTPPSPPAPFCSSTIAEGAMLDEQNSQDLDMAVSSTDVIELIGLLEDADVTVWVDGGWGVDALLGEQTRAHGDLDIDIPVTDVPVLQQVLAGAGFVHTPADDDRPWNFVMTDHRGRQVDVHVLRIDADGNGWYGRPGEQHLDWPADVLLATGTIDGRTVRTMDAAWQVASHDGYELRADDRADIRALCARFDLPVPDRALDP